MKAAHRNLLNFVVFQVAWFACVIAGASDRALVGTLVVAGAVGLHLALAPAARREAALVLIVSSLGLFWDSLIVSLGLMSYPSGTIAPGVAPVWIVAMWALFATTLNGSLSWLKGRPLLAALMGGIGGPLAYLAGQRLGGIEIIDPVLGLVAQGLGWSVLMPLLTMIAARLNGFESADSSPPAPRVGHGGPRHV
jgi:hypothetical protein